MQTTSLQENCADLLLLYPTPPIFGMVLFVIITQITPTRQYLPWWIFPALLVRRYVIYYNERLPGITHPKDYSQYAFADLCEVEVFGKFIFFSNKENVLL